jgi:hypothetical protein
MAKTHMLLCYWVRGGEITNPSGDGYLVHTSDTLCVGHAFESGLCMVVSKEH